MFERGQAPTAPLLTIAGRNTSQPRDGATRQDGLTQGFTMIRVLSTYFERSWRDERGQAFVEYALVIALVSLGLLGTMYLLLSGITPLGQWVADLVEAGGGLIP